MAAIVGGARIGDKIGAIDALLKKVASLLIGGGMALKAMKGIVFLAFLADKSLPGLAILNDR
jgi:3-phosphoglycerate kinase